MHYNLFNQIPIEKHLDYFNFLWLLTKLRWLYSCTQLSVYLEDWLEVEFWFQNLHEIFILKFFFQIAPCGSQSPRWSPVILSSRNTCFCVAPSHIEQCWPMWPIRYGENDMWLQSLVIKDITTSTLLSFGSLAVEESRRHVTRTLKQPWERLIFRQTEDSHQQPAPNC